MDKKKKATLRALIEYKKNPSDRTIIRLPTGWKESLQKILHKCDIS